MNTLTTENLRQGGVPAHLFQSAQGVPLGNGRPGLYDPYATAVARANAEKNGMQIGLNRAAAAGATTGAPRSIYGGGGGNTELDGGGVSQNDWSNIGWPWGDHTEQFPIDAFGISGLGNIGDALGGLVDDAKAFATKPVFGFPLWAVAGAGLAAAVASGVMKNPLKKIKLGKLF